MKNDEKEDAFCRIIRNRTGMLTCAEAFEKLPPGVDKLFLSAFASDRYGETAALEPFDQLLADLLCNIRHLEDADAQQLDREELAMEAAHADIIDGFDPNANKLRAGAVVLAMKGANIPSSPSGIAMAKAAIFNACALLGISEDDVKAAGDYHYEGETATMA